MIDGSKIWLLLWNTGTREFQYETLNAFCDNNLVSLLAVSKNHLKAHRPLIVLAWRDSKEGIEALENEQGKLAKKIH